MKSSIANYNFSQVPSVVRPRSSFDRSRTYKTTFDSGYLIPFFYDEVLPGDTFSVDVTAFSRLTTPIVPFMDNLWMDFHFFFVPNRLVWSNWQRFCGEQDNPDDSTDFLVPQVTVTADGNDLFDYFGLPLNAEVTVNSLLFRSYNLIWNEWYRDENIQDSVPCDTGDGPDDASDYVLLRRGKRKSDPFTSALPWPQKGPGVELPLGGQAPVATFDSSGNAYPAYLNPKINPQSTDFTIYGNSYADFADSAIVNTSASDRTFPMTRIYQDSSSGQTTYALPLSADLSQATAITINSLREAFQVQKWYEQLARGGSRYRELVLSMFGVNTGDARLQRPEYLGGGTAAIQIHAVAQTSATSNVTPQGNLAAFAVAGKSGIGFSKSFVEHGHILGLVSVRADYSYMNGLDRMWSRQTKFDFYWPAFAHLGEVGIKNKEIYYANDAPTDNQIFGYQERWFEYRYGINKITGDLRQSLMYWHLAQDFDNTPTLNSTFIQENPPVSRVLAVQNAPQFLFDSLIRCKCARVMPVYSVPGLVDHF